jgi:tetrahydromethanopterin S-methyltransferase subunit D
MLRFQIGALDNFIMSNIVRSAAYIAANVGVLPVVDANTALSYAFEEGTGTTTADGSANGFTGTLHNSTVWV